MDGFEKEHREFFVVDETGWEPAEPGIERKTLAGTLDHERKVGHLNCLARWAPNALLDEVRVHEFHEEVFIASGTYFVASQEDPERWEEFPAFSFACRPPGVPHGPFRAGPEGCVLLETMFYSLPK